MFTKIGFLGLGVMGEPICRNIQQKFKGSVIVYDQQSEPLSRLASFGAQIASSIREVVEKSEIIFLSLPSGEVVHHVAHASDGLLENVRPHQYIIDLSTSPVSTTRILHSKFHEKGATFIDAPVARTRAAAESGTLSIMVGSTLEQFQTIHPLLSYFATEITHCGSVGCGQVVKILNNMVLFETVVALSEARAIAIKTGVDPQTLFETFTKGSADSFALRNHGLKAILPEDFPEKAFPVDYARKDLRYALQLAEENNVSALGAQNVEYWLEKAIQYGVKDHYFPIISRIIDQSIPKEL